MLVVSSVVEILWLEEVFDHGLLGLTRIKRMTRVTMYYFQVTMLMSHPKVRILRTISLLDEQPYEWHRWMW